MRVCQVAGSPSGGLRYSPDLSPAARLGIALGALAELAVTAYALQDLLRRPTTDVRGPKSLWGVALFVQPIGSPLYLLAGRRGTA